MYDYSVKWKFKNFLYQDVFDLENLPVIYILLCLYYDEYTTISTQTFKYSLNYSSQL